MTTWLRYWGRVRIGFVGCALLQTSCSQILGDDRKPPLRSAWTVNTEAIGLGGWLGVPAAADGRVFFMIGNKIVALSAENGTVLWSHRTTTDPPRAERIIVRDGVVFVTDALGVFALDAVTGAERWHVIPAVSARNGGVELDDLAAYIGTGDRRLLALSLATGQELWQVQLHPEWQYPATVTGITAAGDALYVSFHRFLVQFGGQSKGVIIALDRRDGRLLWEYESVGSQNSVTSPVTVHEDLLLAPDQHGGRFFALNRFTGREVWSVDNHPAAVGNRWAPIVIGSVAYSGDGYGLVYAVDVRTGARRWTTELGTFVAGLGTCGNALIVQNTTLRLLSASSGKPLATLPERTADSPSSVPVTMGRRVFVSTQKSVEAADCN